MKANSKLLTPEQIKKAKSALKELIELHAELEFMAGMKDDDNSTNGIAYEAEQAHLELGDKIFKLQSILNKIENF